MKVKKYILKNRLGLVLSDKRFSDLTTMKVGGKIRCLFYPTTIENLINVVEFLQSKKEKYFVIGNGSNIVASDKLFKPLVINGKHLIKSIEYKDDYFVVSAFMDLRVVIAKLIEKQISTLTNLSGIPATVGGAIVMNAGAFKSNISDNLLWVKYIEDGKCFTKSSEELSFGYRESQFKKENVIVLEAAFKIIKDNETVLNYKNILEKRKERHPLNFPNSGSIFRNKNDIKAFEIIKEIGLVGVPIGGAKFSEKHANFIVNFNNAKALDVYKLIFLAKKRALNLKKINLIEEIILLNFSPFRIVFKHPKK